MRHVTAHVSGYVTDLRDGGFIARVEDCDEYEYIVDVDSKEIINPEELPYLQVGAMFEWAFFSDGSQQLVFYKDKWTQEDIDEMHAQAQEWYEYFNPKIKETADGND